MPEERFSLKDHLFNRTKVRFLANCLAQADPDFPVTKFTNQAVRPFPELELKQRIQHLAETLEGYLPSSFPEAAKIIRRSLPEELDPTKTDDDFGDFIFAPLGQFVVRQGLAKKQLPQALKTLKDLTKRFSMEDSIRPFLNHFPDPVFALLEQWAEDPNYHVRRLVSEGTRPRLPWSGRLTTDPLRALPLLEKLHSDPTRYVTRSVANHLNDLTRESPSTVLKTLRNWKRDKKQNAKELDWITRHSLRTLVKQGSQPALKMLGFGTAPKVTLSGLKIKTSQLPLGEPLEFEFQLSAQAPEKLMVDYQITFVKARAQRSAKIFKLKQLELAKDQTLVVSKKHPLRKNATTFRLYPGRHTLSIQINGQILAESDFTLLDC